MLISFEVTAKLICVFVFAYANCWFSHDAAHIFPLSEITVFLLELFNITVTLEYVNKRTKHVLVIFY